MDADSRSALLAGHETKEMGEPTLFPGRGLTAEELRVGRAGAMGVSRRGRGRAPGRGATAGEGLHVESLDYDDNDNHIKRVHTAKLAETNPEHSTAMTVKRYLLVSVIGIATGVTAVFITWGTRLLSYLKYKVIAGPLFEQERAGTLPFGCTLAAVVAANCLFVTIATLLVVFLEPSGAGSGIPEIKCLLNGMKIKRVVRIKTLFTKAIGVLFSVSGGLPVGKEGPMIHSGAILGAGLSQGKSTTMGFDTSFARFQDFRNDKEKRDFISCGAAAGVAAAFGAPIGGCLFALEEGSRCVQRLAPHITADLRCSTLTHMDYTNADAAAVACSMFSATLAPSYYCVCSASRACHMRAHCIPHTQFYHTQLSSLTYIYTLSPMPLPIDLFHRDDPTSWWHPTLTALTFFCAVLSSFTTNLLLSGINEDGLMDSEHTWGLLSESSGMFTFGDFAANALAPDKTGYNVWEIPLFVLLGILGGLVGATFNGVNRRITEMRTKYPCRGLHIVDALTTTIVMTLVGFFVSHAFGPNVCRENPSTKDTVPGVPLVQFYCPDGHYNQVATLLFNPTESAIKQLLHFQDTSAASVGNIFIWILPIAWLAYTPIACWTYGLSVPSGLFIPSLFSGALMGRLFGQLVDVMTGDDVHANAGNYALIGAAAALGGMARMVISLTVILVESTGDVQFTLPLVLTLMAARAVGNLFNEGLYDIHIHLKHIPFLEWDPPAFFRLLEARHIMTPDPKVLRQVERAGRIFDILKDTDHNGFPVVKQAALPIDGRTLARSGRDNQHSPGRRTSTEEARHRRAGTQDSGGSSDHLFVAPQRRLAGFVLRKQLCTLLSDKYKHRVLQNFRHRPTRGASGRGRTTTRGGARMGVSSGLVGALGGLTETDTNAPQEPLDWADIENGYPRYVPIRDVSLTEEERLMWVDLTPYMNRTPNTVQGHATAARAFRLFRTLGLRHLPVVDGDGDVTGVLTRKDLDEEYCRTRLREVAQGPSFESWSPTPAHRRTRASSH